MILVKGEEDAGSNPVQGHFAGVVELVYTRGLNPLALKRDCGIVARLRHMLGRDELKDRLDEEGIYYRVVEINQEAYIAVPCMDTTTGEFFVVELKFDSSGNFLSHERID